MKVLYDSTVLGLGQLHKTARTGIFRVVDNVAKELVRLTNKDDLSFMCDSGIHVIIAAESYFSNTEEYKLSNFLLPPDYSRRAVLAKKRAEVFKKITENHSFNFSKLKDKVYFKLLSKQNERLSNKGFDINEIKNFDIYHSPFYAINQEVKQSGIKNHFLTIYDLIPVLYPHFFEQDTKDNFTRIISSIDYNTWILCISESTRNDLLNFMGNKVNPNKVYVTELAASNIFYQSLDKNYNALVRAKYNIPNVPYVLSLCTLEPRKNIDKVIKSFANLVQQQKLNDLHLVLVGTKGWNFDKIFDEINANEEVKRRIIVTGFMADEDLAAIYSDALMFVYPSYYEGFGLPPLEAMQCGVPVITSNTSSLPEVVGDAGIMVDPDDVDALSKSILRVYTDEALRQKMSAASLLQAKKFSWERCAQETIAAYQLSLRQY